MEARTRAKGHPAVLRLTSCSQRGLSCSAPRRPKAETKMTDKAAGSARAPRWLSFAVVLHLADRAPTPRGSPLARRCCRRSASARGRPQRSPDGEQTSQRGTTEIVAAADALLVSHLKSARASSWRSLCRCAADDQRDADAQHEEPTEAEGEATHTREDDTPRGRARASVG